MMDLPTTISKMIAAGMSATEVVLRSTWNPAQIIRHPELGHLTPGAVADIAAFRVLTGEYDFADSEGGRLAGRSRIFCELTIKDGRIAWDWNARGAVDYRKLPADYGVREGEFVVPPPGR
jgi:dihydroorotase